MERRKPLVCVYDVDVRYHLLFAHKQILLGLKTICTDFMVFQLQYLLANVCCTC